MREDVLTKLDEHIEGPRKVRELIARIITIPGKINIKWYEPNSVRIDINSVDQLHEARSYLRAVLGKWEDELTRVFYANGRGIGVYENDSPIELWLFFDPHNPPEGLVKHGCRFVERTTTDYDFVCDNR